jgi:hypothetical protein
MPEDRSFVKELGIIMEAACAFHWPSWAGQSCHWVFWMCDEPYSRSYVRSQC